MIVTRQRLDQLPDDVLEEIQKFSVNPATLLVNKRLNAIRHQLYQALFKTYRAEYTLTPFLSLTHSIEGRVRETAHNVFQFGAPQRAPTLCKASEFKNLVQKKNFLLILPRIFEAAQRQLIELSPYQGGMSIKTWLKKNERKIKKISELDLSNQPFLYAIPSEIHFFSGLRVLNLSNNNLRKITNVVKKLPKLQKLIVSGNKIDRLEELHKMKTLRELYLGNNRIRDISEIKPLKNLEILSLDGNLIEEIPRCVKKLERLFRLTLEQNPLSENSIHFLEELYEVYGIEIVI